MPSRMNNNDNGIKYLIIYNIYINYINMNDLFRRPSKIVDMKAKLQNEISLKRSSSPNLPELPKKNRISNLEERLGLKQISNEERFEDTLKQFKGLDTFFTIN